jgi:hypothetical protein
MDFYKMNSRRALQFAGNKHSLFASCKEEIRALIKPAHISSVLSWHVLCSIRIDVWVTKVSRRNIVPCRNADTAVGEESTPG